MSENIRDQDNEIDNYERLAIKGFEWLQEDLQNFNTKNAANTGFRNFRIQDQKKKWKKKNCKSFQGFANRINQVLESKPNIRKQNISNIKKELFQKQLEEINLKNKISGLQKLKSVLNIYEKQKKFRATTINNYFNQ